MPFGILGLLIVYFIQSLQSKNKQNNVFSQYRVKYSVCRGCFKHTRYKQFLTSNIMKEIASLDERDSTYVG